MSTMTAGNGKRARPGPTPEFNFEADEMIATDDEVRELAYRKWEAAGRPCSDGVCYWLEAEHELLLGGPRKNLRRYARKPAV